MKKKRMTRNSFKRKVILFGIMAFMSIALVATGFAAWVISGNATSEANHNVTIGAVTDKSMTMKLDTTAANILFECDEDDDSGRIRKDGEKFEKLDIVISGQIYDAIYLSELTIKMQLDSAIITAAGDDTNPKYIKLPANYNSEIKLNKLPDGTTNFNSGEGYYVIDGTGEQSGMKVAVFKYTISFEWGDFFGGVNPGYWYDGVIDGEGTLHESQDGAEKDIDTVLAEMNAFRMLLNGTDDPEEAGTPAPITITVVGLAG